MTVYPLYLATLKQSPGFRFTPLFMFLRIIIILYSVQNLNNNVDVTLIKIKSFIKFQLEALYISNKMNSQNQKHIYQTDYISLKKVTKILTCLRKSELGSVMTKIECQDRQIIEMLKQNLNSKKRARAKKENYSILGKTDITSQEARKKKFKKTIQFNVKFVAMIFMNQYKKKLRSLAEDYSLYMIWQGEFIRVFSDSPISPIFQSQILEMKHRLQWSVFSDEKLYLKIKYSKLVQQKFTQFNIRFLLLARYGTLVLHSSSVMLEDIRKAKNYFSYDALVLEFSNEVYSKRMNKIYFKMLSFYLEPFLAQISKNYELACQISWKRFGAILHTQDPIFSSQPKHELTLFLQKIVFITYYTKNLASHMMHIRQNKPKQNCLQFMMTDSFIHTSWNTNKPIEPQEVRKIFKKFIQQLNLKTILRVCFKSGGLSFRLVERVEEIAEKYKLYTYFPYQNDEQGELIHIQVKSLVNKKQKQQNLIMFLQELITDQSIDPKQIKQSQLKQQTDSQSLSSHDQQVAQQQINEQSHELQLLNESRQKEQRNDGPISFNYEIEKPMLTVGSQVEIKRGKRNYQIEGYLEQNLGVVSKVWDIKVETNQDVQFLQQFEQHIKCQIFFLQKSENQSFLHTNFDQLNLAYKLQVDKEYYLISKVTANCRYFTTHLVVIYSHDL